ncbi:MAG: hypothetical protein WCT10_02060 [Patescibacteria group bacterium]|jgi:hypothetical protein
MDTPNIAPNPGFEKPPGTPTAALPGANSSETVIHVIPDEFYGAALKKKVVEPPKKPAVPAPAAAANPPASKPPQPKKRSALPIILIVIFLLLALGGSAAYYFLVYQPGQKAKGPVQPAINTNANIPAGPVCGDNRCESGENFAVCPADCPSPGPVCGDNKCEAPETVETCSADCVPPGPVCGDNKCEEPETLETCAADCEPPEPTPGADSDFDGVTDAEETGIYGSDMSNPDSDGDSFVDLNEVLNLFDPARPRPALLVNNPGIAVYKSAVQGYEIFRPASWVVSEKGEDGKETYFTSPKGEFIQVLVETNDTDKTLLDWYLEQSPGVVGSEVQLLKTLGGHEEILSPDKMTAFVAAGKRIFIVSYNLGGQNKLDYAVTFKMVVNSLKVAE